MFRVGSKSRDLKGLSCMTFNYSNCADNPFYFIAEFPTHLSCYGRSSSSRKIRRQNSENQQKRTNSNSTFIHHMRERLDEADEGSGDAGCMMKERKRQSTLSPLVDKAETIHPGKTLPLETKQWTSKPCLYVRKTQEQCRWQIMLQRRISLSEGLIYQLLYIRGFDDWWAREGEGHDSIQMFGENFSEWSVSENKVQSICKVS